MGGGAAGVWARSRAAGRRGRGRTCSGGRAAREAPPSSAAGPPPAPAAAEVISNRLRLLKIEGVEGGEAAPAGAAPPAAADDEAM